MARANRVALAKREVPVAAAVSAERASQVRSGVDVRDCSYTKCVIDHCHRIQHICSTTGTHHRCSSRVNSFGSIREDFLT